MTDMFLIEPGTMADISVADDGELWAVTADDEVRRWNDGEWQPVEGNLKQIAVGSIDQIWGVDRQGAVHRWVGDWLRVPGTLAYIAAASDGTVIGIDANDDLFRWNGATFEPLAGHGKLMQVSVADRKIMYGVSRDGVVLRWNGGGWDSCLVSGAPREFTYTSASTSPGALRWWMGWAPQGERPGRAIEIVNGGMVARDTWMRKVAVSATQVVALDATGRVRSWQVPLEVRNRPLVRRQLEWRWCQNCHGLFFGGRDTMGTCPARPVGVIVTRSVPHVGTSSMNYAVPRGAGAPGQSGWRWCHKCEGLFFAARGGICRAGGAHDGSASDVYALLHQDTTSFGQSGWLWCRKCEGLFHSSGASRCPAGDAHDGSASGAYKLAGY